MVWHGSADRGLSRRQPDDGKVRPGASKYNIQSIQTYELYDDPAGGEGAYGLLQNDGTTPKASYTAFKNFVAANPK